MPVNVGAAVGRMVNVNGPLVPVEVDTVTPRAPSVAPEPITNIAVADVALTTTTLPVVMLVPASTVMPEKKFVPVRVTEMFVP